MSKVALIGASSFLGRHLFAHLKGGFSVVGTCYRHPITPELVPLDITAPQDVQAFLEREQPDYLVWLAGNKDLKACETDPAASFRLNVRPVERLIEVLGGHRNSIPVLYVSSDYVFAGDRGHYRDSDPTHPNTVYGKDKEACENLLLGSGLPAKIIRTSAVVGPGGVFFQWMLDAILGSRELNLFSNIHFSPTPVTFFAERMAALIADFERIESSRLHLVMNNRLSRYAFGEAVLGFMDKPSCRIQPEEIDLTHALFRRDLSLVASAGILDGREPSFASYLEREVRACLKR